MAIRWGEKPGRLWSSTFPFWAHLIGPERFPQVCLGPLRKSSRANTIIPGITVRSVLPPNYTVLHITSFPAPISPYSSSQKSTARCSITERIRNLAQRKSRRSWCWPRECWRRSEAGNHSSPSGSLWMRKQMRPRNVCVFHSWPTQHTSSFSVGPENKNSKPQGNIWSNN